MLIALALDDARLEVNPNAGGRVTSLRLGDSEILSGSDADANNYGSTFWTSPQADWSWPPPAEIDHGIYTFAWDGGALVLTGECSRLLGVRVTKRLSVDRAREAFVLEYSIHNMTPTPKAYAPWEVSRVRPGGLTFFPAASPVWGTLERLEREGAIWLAPCSGGLTPAGQKVFAAGEGGLLAHAASGMLFVKSFDPVPHAKQAPGEAAIEVYANNRYVELEVQGPYAEIQPYACASWTVRWYLRKLPHGARAPAPSSDLLALAVRLSKPSR